MGLNMTNGICGDEISQRRYAAPRQDASVNRGLKSPATVVASQSEAGQPKLMKQLQTKRRLTCADLMEDLIGSQPGSTDASSNKDYLEKSLLKDYSRGRQVIPVLMPPSM